MKVKNELIFARFPFGKQVSEKYNYFSSSHLQYSMFII